MLMLAKGQNSTLRIRCIVPLGFYYFYVNENENVMKIDKR